MQVSQYKIQFVLRVLKFELFQGLRLELWVVEVEFVGLPTICDVV